MYQCPKNTQNHYWWHGKLPQVYSFLPQIEINANDGLENRDLSHELATSGVVNEDKFRMSLLADFSWPQAAMISRPRGTRIGAESSLSLSI